MTKDEAEGIRFLAENESQFQELIDSQEWYLLNEAGTKEVILIPIFDENGVTCRWNFTKGQP